jgi:diguanylate cyclase (GGDEF)-like protein
VRRRRLRLGDVPVYDEEDFETELKRELSKCKRVERPLTLILIQVDDLSEIIELFGKDFREPVLWHVAEQAMASLREVDLVGMMTSKSLVAMTAFASDRYGGGRIVSRMRQAVAKRPFRVGEELPPIVPALHFGMATFPHDGTEASSLIASAERELSAD